MVLRVTHFFYAFVSIHKLPPHLLIEEGRREVGVGDSLKTLWGSVVLVFVTDVFLKNCDDIVE